MSSTSLHTSPMPTASGHHGGGGYRGRGAVPAAKPALQGPQRRQQQAQANTAGEAHGDRRADVWPVQGQRRAGGCAEVAGHAEARRGGGQRRVRGRGAQVRQHAGADRGGPGAGADGQDVRLEGGRLHRGAPGGGAAGGGPRRVGGAAEAHPGAGRGAHHAAAEPPHRPRQDGGVARDASRAGPGGRAGGRRVLQAPHRPQLQRALHRHAGCRGAPQRAQGALGGGAHWREEGTGGDGGGAGGGAAGGGRDWVQRAAQRTVGQLRRGGQLRHPQEVPPREGHRPARRHLPAGQRAHGRLSGIRGRAHHGARGVGCGARGRPAAAVAGAGAAADRHQGDAGGVCALQDGAAPRWRQRPHAVARVCAPPVQVHAALRDAGVPHPGAGAAQVQARGRVWFLAHLAQQLCVPLLGRAGAGRGHPQAAGRDARPGRRGLPADVRAGAAEPGGRRQHRGAVPDALCGLQRLRGHRGGAGRGHRRQPVRGAAAERERDVPPGPPPPAAQAWLLLRLPAQDDPRQLLPEMPRKARHAGHRAVRRRRGGGPRVRGGGRVGLGGGACRQHLPSAHRVGRAQQQRKRRQRQRFLLSN
mmetsp:Transcript_35430/g.92056  ORF Transcript_35430/g.92056 Transcript_35430/m.92056 type:complete len:586 (+) Transcript_35430:182-1939(+)